MLERWFEIRKVGLLRILRAGRTRLEWEESHAVQTMGLAVVNHSVHRYSMVVAQKHRQRTADAAAADGHKSDRGQPPRRDPCRRRHRWEEEYPPDVRSVLEPREPLDCRRAA